MLLRSDDQIHEQWYTSAERDLAWHREAPSAHANLGRGEENLEKWKLQHSGWRPRACAAQDWLLSCLTKGDKKAGMAGAGGVVLGERGRESESAKSSAVTQKHNDNEIQALRDLLVM